jgi:hypothetical protein
LNDLKETYFKINAYYRWLPRSRIRIYLEGQNLENLQPIELHDQVLNQLEHRYIEHVAENRNTQLSKTDNVNLKSNGESASNLYRIPSLSLNEVFIGESLSAR